MTTCTPKKRNAGLILGGLLAVVTGLLALTPPSGLNLVICLASVAGGAAYLHQRKWAVWVFLVAVVGHFVSHGILIAQHIGRVGGLWVMPLLSLVILGGMINCRRCGRIV